MAYFPPSCGSVNFLLKPLIIPICSSVNFSLKDVSLDIGISSSLSIINIFNEPFYYFEGSFIVSETSSIKIVNKVVPFTAMSNIGSGDSRIKIISPEELIRVLPDCISQQSVIKINSKLSEIVAGLSNDLPNGINHLYGATWGGASSLDEFLKLNWKEATNTDNIVHLMHGENNELDKITKIVFNELKKVDNFIVNKNSSFENVDKLTSILWNSLLITDTHRKIVYSDGDNIDVKFLVNYLQPEPKDISKKMLYGGINDASKTFIFNWNAPGPVDKHHLVPWGPISYFKFCTTHYYPSLGCSTNFVLQPVYEELIGTCFQVRFNVEGLNTDPRCPYDHYRTGRRDPYISGIPVITPYFPPKKEAYYMLNTVLVKRLPDNLPIEVTSIDIKYDKESWLWQFSLSIGKDKTNYLDMIKPNPDNLNMYTDIEININGWIWVCRVEGWNESRVFSKDSWTITGRSPSMELSSPQNQKTSFTYDPGGSDVTSGAQIIDDVLRGTMLGIDDTGWSVDWSEYGSNIHTGFNPDNGEHWGINPNTFTWTDQTQIEVVKQLADSIGAFLMTVPDCKSNKKLIAKPRFNIPPWHWNETSIYRPTYQHMILSDYASEIGRSYESLTTYNAVYVMGQSSSVAQSPNTTPGIPVVEVFREGFAQSNRIYAPDLVDPWITTSKSALERGRMVICDTGEWIRHSFRLFSLAKSTDESPLINKLLIPGDYVSINENGSIWPGEIDSVQISAVSNDSAFIVYQTVEISQYIGS